MSASLNLASILANRVSSRSFFSSSFWGVVIPPAVADFVACWSGIGFHMTRWVVGADGVPANVGVEVPALRVFGMLIHPIVRFHKAPDV